MTIPTEAPRTAAGQELLGVVMRLGPKFIADIGWVRDRILAIEAEAAAPASPDVVEALESLKQPHLIVEDCWYSCPKAVEDGDPACCNDQYDHDNPPCWCGADARNEKIDRILAALPAAAPAPPDVERQAAYVVSGLPVALRLDFIREVARQIGYTVVAATPPTDEIQEGGA